MQIKVEFIVSYLRNKSKGQFQKNITEVSIKGPTHPPPYGEKTRNDILNDTCQMACLGILVWITLQTMIEAKKVPLIQRLKNISVTENEI